MYVFIYFKVFGDFLVILIVIKCIEVEYFDRDIWFIYVDVIEEILFLYFLLFCVIYGEF